MICIMYIIHHNAYLYMVYPYISYMCRASDLWWKSRPNLPFMKRHMWNWHILNWSEATCSIIGIKIKTVLFLQQKALRLGKAYRSQLLKLVWCIHGFACFGMNSCACPTFHSYVVYHTLDSSHHDSSSQVVGIPRRLFLSWYALFNCCGQNSCKQLKDKVLADPRNSDQQAARISKRQHFVKAVLLPDIYSQNLPNSWLRDLCSCKPVLIVLH